jgi:hypothetical protein
MTHNSDPAPTRSGGFRRKVAGRLVVVSIGSVTQTINICTSQNQPGMYERTARLLGVPPVTPEEIERLADLDSLSRWIADFGDAAVDETGGTARRHPAPLIPSPNVDDPWLVRARDVVETSINRLVDEFMKEPFLHRVEHSVHAQLFCMLVKDPELGQTYKIGDTGRLTQLVHKEWPETHIDRESGSWKRGSFDLAVLAPSQVAQASLQQIRTGRIEAGIVIEMGLNYRLSHLDQDYKKLVTNNVGAGYLVHLSRDNSRSAEVEDFLRRVDLDPRIKIAYGHWGERGERAYKLIDDADIR